MISWIIGAALGPFAAVLLFLSLKSLFLVAGRSGAAPPFLAGFLGAACMWAVGKMYGPSGAIAKSWDALDRRAYIFGHELAHVLAAWASGAKVFSFHVGRRQGHVDLDKSNAFIALAPYILPVYAVASLLLWRAFLAFKPQAPAAPFLALTGLGLAFHLTKTLEYLWDLSQPDLKAAGGILFSLSVIAAANGLLVLALAKTLFPSCVSFVGALRLSWHLGLRFWIGAAKLAAAAWTAARAR